MFKPPYPLTPIVLTPLAIKYKYAKMLSQVPTFGETIESIFAKTDMPEMMRSFFLHQVPPIASLGVLASCVSVEDALLETLSALPVSARCPGTESRPYAGGLPLRGLLHARDLMKYTRQTSLRTPTLKPRSQARNGWKSSSITSAATATRFRQTYFRPRGL